MGKLVLVSLLLVACGSSSRPGNGGTDGSNQQGGDADQSGCGGLSNCFSVYAHSNDTLYVIDLQAKTLQTIGKFNTPQNDVITDLAVAPDNTIYVISNTALYTASATDGHTTKVGTLAACGTKGVALSTLANGDIWEGDFSGNLCKIDISTNPPTVGAPLKMANNMALSGDLVGIGDGTVYGTAYKLSDQAGQGTQASNLLVKLDLTTGGVTTIGATGYPKLFGVSVAQGKVMGFTHDQTGHVVSIDPVTGSSTIYATFNDPASGQPISFAGAGVNSMIVIQ